MATDTELYERLGVSHEATEKEIVRAYRKKALACHPDKNPDNPKAAELFHELSKALGVLTDASARAAYDKTLRAKKAAELRHKELNSKRKKFKEDLEAREAAAQDNKAQQTKLTRNLQEEIARLRKEGSRLVQEEKDRLLEEIKKEREKTQEAVAVAAEVAAEVAASPGARLKVKWRAGKSDTENGGYNRQNLMRMLNKYGEVSALLLSEKRNGSAVVEFSSSHDAVRAVQHEVGLEDNPITLSWLSGQPAQRPDQYHSLDARTDTSDQPTINPKSSLPESHDFESLVLRRMRQAEERRKLIEQIAEQEEEAT